MEENKYAFSYTWYQHFYHDIHHLGKVVKTKYSVDYNELLKGNDIGCLTVMIDCSKIHNIIMPCQYHEDYITWLNILKKDGGLTPYQKIWHIIEKVFLLLRVISAKAYGGLGMCIEKVKSLAY